VIPSLPGRLRVEGEEREMWAGNARFLSQGGTNNASWPAPMMRPIFEFVLPQAEMPHFLYHSE
jgi:hypothetical protein